MLIGGIVSLTKQQLGSMHMKVTLTLDMVVGKVNAAGGGGDGEKMESAPFLRSKAATIVNSGGICESLDTDIKVCKYRIIQNMRCYEFESITLDYVQSLTSPCTCRSTIGYLKVQTGEFAE